MQSFQTFITESAAAASAAEKRYKSLEADTKAVGSHASARVYYKHTGGSLQRHFIGDANHKSYSDETSTSGNGHFFGQFYSSRPGHAVYMHIKLPLKFDLSNKAALEKEIVKQNPHTKGMGHPSVFASDIVKYEG